MAWWQHGLIMLAVALPFLGLIILIIESAECGGHWPWSWPGTWWDRWRP